MVTKSFSLLSVQNYNKAKQCTTQKGNYFKKIKRKTIWFYNCNKSTWKWT